jgi:polyphenol oxidase
MLEAAGFDLIVPDWPSPVSVTAFFTTRQGGVSQYPYASFNLGAHVGDEADAVAENRRRFAGLLPSSPMWLNQVHGSVVVNAADVKVGQTVGQTNAADACVATAVNLPALVLVADCLPVLLTDARGACVAAAHAGWRGLCAGVLEATVAAMSVPASELMAWLGPAIGPQAFEVGAEVRAAFLAKTSAAEEHELIEAAFVRHGSSYPEKYLADIYALAHVRLRSAGVSQIYGGGFCTVSDPERFFSYRRDGQCGRMAAAIWRNGQR